MTSGCSVMCSCAGKAMPTGSHVQPPSCSQVERAVEVAADEVIGVGDGGLTLAELHELGVGVLPVTVAGVGPLEVGVSVSPGGVAGVADLGDLLAGRHPVPHLGA